jgi:hypothetical protein
MSMAIQTVLEDDSDFVRVVAKEVLDAYDGRGIEWVHPNASTLWKINSGERAGVVGLDIEGRRCCVKLFYDERLWVRFRNSMGFSKAGRAFGNALKLKDFGVGCPKMIGLVRVGFSGPFMLVSELCDYAQRTDHHVSEHGINACLVKSFAVFVRQMHARGVSHVDFSLRNTMVVANDREPFYRFLMLDYEDVRFGKSLSRKRRLNNLHHLLERALKLVPLKWRLVFLREYLGGGPIHGWVDELNDCLEKHPSKYTKGLFG